MTFSPRILPVLLLVAGVSESATITYTSSAAFLAAVAGLDPITEGYESVPLGTALLNGTTLNGLQYSFSNPLGAVVGDVFGNIDTRSLYGEKDGLPGASGNDFFFPGESITVQFPGAVRAFGLFVNVFNSSVQTDYVFLNTSAGSAFSGGPVWDIPGMFFVGLVSDTTFGSATFGVTELSPSGFNVDNLTYAAVPEPGTVFLVSVALFVAVSRRRSF